MLSAQGRTCYDGFEPKLEPKDVLTTTKKTFISLCELYSKDTKMVKRFLYTFIILFLLWPLGVNLRSPLPAWAASELKGSTEEQPCPKNPGPNMHDGHIPPPPGPYGSGGSRILCKAEPQGSFIAPPGHGPAPLKKVKHHSVGYHWLGAQTSQDTVSIYGQIYVTDPSTRQGTNDSVFARFLEYRLGKWIEVGWVEGGGGRQMIYVFDTVHGGHEYPQYPINPGDTIWVQLVLWNETGTTWRANLLWNGQWITLHEVDVGFEDADTAEEFVEIYTADGFHFNVPRTDIRNVQIHDGVKWSYWTRDYPTTPYNSDPPYDTHWISEYYNFYVDTH